MSIIATAVRHLMAAGVTGEALVAAIADMEAQVRAARTVPAEDNRSRRGLTDREWQDLRSQVFDRDDYACVYCGCPHDLACDHIVPLVRGGTNALDNLATACRPCNRSKGAKLVEEWRR